MGSGNALIMDAHEDTIEARKSRSQSIKSAENSKIASRGESTRAQQPPVEFPGWEWKIFKGNRFSHPLIRCRERPCSKHRILRQARFLQFSRFFARIP